MITNLPAAFETELVKTSRQPIQLAHFLLDGITYYLSDKPVGVADGLAQDYSPWIESWGTLKDNTDINSVFSGSTLQIRASNITIISNQESKAFIDAIFAEGVENIVVELYQWFNGLSSAEVVLIDTMVCQDPISITEASMLFKLDVVSIIMRNNPYLYQPVIGEDSREVIIGEATGVPLVDLQTSRVTKLSEDIAFDYLGQVYIDNGVGFTSSGVIYVDNEQISYDWISAGVINITGRGVNATTARPHISGATVSIPGANYDYAVSAGPVTSITNVQADGEDYLNSYTAIIDQNPTLLRFVNRPPWSNVEINEGIPIQPPDTTDTLYGASYWGIRYNSGNSWTTSPNSINSEIGIATTILQSRVDGGDYTRLVYKTNFSSSTNTTVTPQTEHDKIYLRGSVLNTYSHDISGGTNDNVTGSVTYGFAGLLTTITPGNGPIYSCSIKVNIIPSRFSYVDATLRIYFVDDALIRTLLLEESISAYNTGFSVWPETIKNLIDLGLLSDIAPQINSVAELESCGIEFEYVNIQADHSQSAASINGSFAPVNVSLDVDYSIDPSDTLVSPIYEFASRFVNDFSHLGTFLSARAIINWRTTNGLALGSQSIFYRITPDYADNIELASETFSNYDQLSAGETEYSLSAITSWAELSEAYMGIKYTMRDVDDDDRGNNRIIQGVIEYVQWLIEYRPALIETPDEERIVYPDVVTCTVTSLMGANPTPASAARYLLENHSDNGPYVDTTAFDARHAEYVNVSYYLNGVLDGDIRLHEALKQILHEGMCRFLFNEGKIKLLTYITDADESIDKTLTLDDIFLRSRSLNNQPITTIKNQVAVQFQKNLVTNAFDGKAQLSDADSIVKFKLQESRKELDLVQTSDIAGIVANRDLHLFYHPITILKARVFMPVGYVLEKGDFIGLPSFLDPPNTVSGHIVSIDRVFGKGKNKQINAYDISLIKYEPPPVSTGDGYGVSNYGIYEYGT